VPSSSPAFDVPTLFRTTAVADKLGVEFALINRKRDGRKEDAPEKMEILVGDVKDKVCRCGFVPDVG